MANNKKTTAAKTSDKRNLKYGSLSVVITVMFVALLIILNIIATAFSPYTDMTASGFYSLSDDFTEEMNKLLHPESGEEVYINTVLLAEGTNYLGDVRDSARVGDLSVVLGIANAKAAAEVEFADLFGALALDVRDEAHHNVSRVREGLEVEYLRAYVAMQTDEVKAFL